jgi:hypothetical protein
MSVKYVRFRTSDFKLAIVGGQPNIVNGFRMANIRIPKEQYLEGDAIQVLFEGSKFLLSFMIMNAETGETIRLDDSTPTGDCDITLDTGKTVKGQYILTTLLGEPADLNVMATYTIEGSATRWEADTARSGVSSVEDI